jgi:uncharacterized membrane protein (DUF4010 family)
VPTQLLSTIPPAVWKLVLVLFLSFLIGLEREELKQREGRRLFGGVRTFPLIGLVGYSVALLSDGQMLSILVGLAVVGVFLALSYWHKLTALGGTGVTTEVSGLLVYLVGALVYQGHVWFACALVVVSLLLLELKEALEGLAERTEPGEILAVAKFLMLTAVILPLVPNHDFGPFAINPFKTWLVVVAVSGVSYASYVILRAAKGRGGVFATALLGGLYSSTVTTVVLARRAAGDPRCRTYSGAILAASGMMYLRVLGLIFLFNRELGKMLVLPLLTLSLLAVVGGWFWHRMPEESSEVQTEHPKPRNPLELRTAFLFAGAFLAMLIITRLVVSHLGQGGAYVLGAIMGVADVDPYIMGMTSYGSGALLPVAASGILIATGANNLAKGSYAAFLARGKAGRWSLLLLGTLAALGLMPLLWL